MDSPSAEIVRWFAAAGDRHVASYLSPTRVDTERLRNARAYGLKLFLFNWAYERAQAPRGYRVAAVKAITAAWPDLGRVAEEYTVFYQGKRNEYLNPAFDPRLAVLDVPAVMALAERGDLATAFGMLRLQGVGTKIRAFFLRDLVTLAGAEDKVDGLGKHVYCQPIDVWVRMSVQLLGLPLPILDPPLSRRAYGFDSPSDFAAALRLADAALHTGVSPLRVNQGIWYFCANAVADAGRLTDLLTTADAGGLERELALIDDFLP